MLTRKVGLEWTRRHCMLIIVGFAPRHLVALQDTTYSVRLLIEMVQRSTSLNSFEISTVSFPNGRLLSRFHGSRPAAAQQKGRG